jgi:hypothetical protein
MTDAARECGIRLAAQCVGELTHRSIAAAVGVAHTALSYRFPTQQDLVVAGLRLHVHAVHAPRVQARAGMHAPRMA